MIERGLRVRTPGHQAFADELVDVERHRAFMMALVSVGADDLEVRPASERDQLVARAATEMLTSGRGHHAQLLGERAHAAFEIVGGVDEVVDDAAHRHILTPRSAQRAHR